MIEVDIDNIVDSPKNLLKIIEYSNKVKHNYSYAEEFNYGNRVEFFRKLYRENKTYFIDDEIDRNGNRYKKPDNYLEDLLNIYHFNKNVFTANEWIDILTSSKCLKFWRDFRDIKPSVCNILGKIYEHRKDIYLEFWQGGLNCLDKDFSDKNVLEMINSKNNGNEYNKAIVELRKILKPLAINYIPSTVEFTLMYELG